jgi:deazaflavin-dependent oxidoreductase (nitroreductase family)
VNADVDYCYLTTVGRVSGKAHEIEVWFAAGDEHTLYLLAGGRDQSDWVKNAMTTPAVTVRIEDTTWRATAEVLAGGDEEFRARFLVFEKYQARYSGDLRNWRDTALPVAVRLAEEVTS